MNSYCKCGGKMRPDDRDTARKTSFTWVCSKCGKRNTQRKRVKK